MAEKLVHSIILDTSPILTNTPPISTLLAKAERLYTVPAVIDEVKDPNARSRLEVTILPFLTIQTPKPESIKFVSDFARKTGDLPVLSKPDIQILALAYELQCIGDGGNSKLRKVPGVSPSTFPRRKSGDGVDSRAQNSVDDTSSNQQQSSKEVPGLVTEVSQVSDSKAGHQDAAPSAALDPDQMSETMEYLHVSGPKPRRSAKVPDVDRVPTEALGGSRATDDAESSGSEGWITPSNLKKQQEKDKSASTVPIRQGESMRVATITGDFAMQNVLLQIGLNLLSSSLQQIRNIRTYILRCHACFEKVKDMSKQFCPRCGKPTLTRVSCSTNHKGEFKVHLKKNMQWNHRGDRYAIPKSVSGAANGKVASGKGGGKGGWGQQLILAEDQKEYQRATSGHNTKKGVDLMDEDYLPSILTGDRGKVGGRPKIGAGRNVNSKKR